MLGDLTQTKVLERIQIVKLKLKILPTGICPQELGNKDFVLTSSISVRNPVPRGPPHPFGGGSRTALILGPYIWEDDWRDPGAESCRYLWERRTRGTLAPKAAIFHDPCIRDSSIHAPTHPSSIMHHSSSVIL
jgi:hypothetical protein